MGLSSVKICTPCAIVVSLLVAASCTARAPDAGGSVSNDASAEQTDGASSDAEIAPVDVDAADAVSSSFGQPCAVGHDTTCGDGFFCLVGPSGGSTGFCTRTCPKASSGACTETPSGTSAYCVVTDVDPQGDKGCAFVCKAKGLAFPCPGALHCESTEDPPGSGQYLCLP